jgi:hypothetical protein
MTSDPPDQEGQLASGAEPPFAEPTSSEPTSSTESSAMQRMRLERDAALEDLAFLREQLRSTQEFYEHRLDLVCARLYAEHRGLLNELTRLGATRPQRSRPYRRALEELGTPPESMDPPPAPGTR